MGGRWPRRGVASPSMEWIGVIFFGGTVDPPEPQGGPLIGTSFPSALAA